MVALAYLVCVSLAALAVLTFGLAALFCAVSDDRRRAVQPGRTTHLSSPAIPQRTNTRRH